MENAPAGHGLTGRAAREANKEYRKSLEEADERLLTQVVETDEEAQASIEEVQRLGDLLGEAVQCVARDNRMMRDFLADIVQGKYSRAADIRRRAADLLDQVLG